MKYIKRSFEDKFLELNEEYSCILLVGPRQVGKSTMLEHLMEGTERKIVTLDDLEERRLARAKEELLQMKNYDYIVVNNSVEEAAEQIRNILNSESLKTKNN